MPAFLVELSGGARTLIGAADSMVVFALDATDARALCASHFDGDSDVLWNDASTVVTEIIAGVALPSNYEFEINITKDGGNGILVPATFKATGGAGNVAILDVAIGDVAGASYVDNEIVTLVGGTFTRAATVRCEGTGAVTAVAVVDPGEYTILPTLDEIVTATGGPGDDNLTIDAIAAPADSYEVMLGQMITLLNANSEIAGAGVDMSELLAGTRLLTITDGGGGDDLGDSTVFIRIGAPLSGNIPGLFGSLTHEGAANAVLSVAIPAIGETTFVVPELLRALKT